MENVGDERRYTRHVYFTGPKDEIIRARLVYDYRKFMRLTVLKMTIKLFAVGSE
jgi:hypothetical protein